jgi:hypothetical protein
VSPDAAAGLVALGAGAFVLSTQRAFRPAVPAIAAPIAVAWPHGAPALGAGVVLGALTLGRPRRLPGPAFVLAVAFAVAIAVAGDGGLVRGAAAAVAIAVVTPAYVRSLEELVVAAVSFGLASAGVALGAAVAGVGGVRAELIAVGAAAGLAAAAASGARAVAACDLAGVLLLPSRAGVVAAVVALGGLLVLRRLALVDAMLAAGAIAIAQVAGAPFAHAPWRMLSAFSDSYHRVGAVGAALFASMLLATAWGLPRPFAPGLVAAAVGAAFVPVEAAASVWLFAGLAAAGGSPDGPLRRARDEERLLRQRQALDAERDALREERRALNRRRKALDEREAALASQSRELDVGSPRVPPAEAPEDVLHPEYRHWNLRVLRGLVEARGDEFPDRLDEWRLYLATLEPFAENGVLGPEFDTTVAEVFGPLVA